MVVVTGAAGFIGSCFLWKLNQESISDIIVVDNLGDNEKWKNLVNKDFLDYYEKQSFLEMIKKDVFFSKVECVIHLGACSSTTLTDANYLLKNNYEYSKEIAMWCIKHNIRLIYASSAATYGDGRYGYSDDIKTIKNLIPLNMYAYSKHLFDLWIVNNNLHTKFVGLKFFNVFGPNEYHKGDMRSVIAKAFNKIKEEKVIKLFKSYKKEYKHGEQKRDFIYIFDVIDMMYHIFTHKKISGIFNIGRGEAHSWNEIAKSIFEYLNLPLRIEYIEMPEELKDKYQYYTCADITKFFSTGYDKKLKTLDASIKDYCRYLEQGRYI